MQNIKNIFPSIFLVLLSIYSLTAQQVPIDHPELPNHPTKYNAIGKNDLLPAGWENNPLVQLGYLPVKLLGAIPNDGKDDSDAIELAILLARDWQYVTYLPKGVYDVSRTISASLKSYEEPGSQADNKFRNNRFFPVQIVGDCSGTGRAVLRLMNNADAKFNVSNPKDKDIKPLLQVYAEVVSSNTNFCASNPTYSKSTCKDPSGLLPAADPRNDINAETSASNFNALIRNIDFDVSGHSSAVGVRFAGAQGCSMENCKITATDAYAGFTGGLGSGGGYFNIEVQGGRYGYVSLNWRITQELLMTGMRFINQEIAVFRGRTAKSHAIVGLYIRKDTPRVFDRAVTDDESLFGTGKGGFVNTEGISIVDAIIDINTDDSNDAVFWLNNNNNLYLENVHIKNATHIVRNDNGNNTPVLSKDYKDFPKGQDYSRIEFFAHQKSATDKYVIWDYGTSPEKSEEDLLKVLSPNKGTPSWPSIINKHVTYFRKDFPCVFSGDDSNPIASDVTVIPASLGIDKYTDSQTIQDAIDNGPNSKIFVPRGVYHLNRPLVLNNNTTLFGASKAHSVLRSTYAMHTRGNGLPLVTTTTSSFGKAVLADVFLNDYLPYLDSSTNSYNNKMSYLNWKQGEKSVVADVLFGDYNPWPGAVNKVNNSFFVKISEGGGGYWYGIVGTHTVLKNISRLNSHRGLIADNASNLNMYSLNYERYGTSDPDLSAQVEFLNSNNINVYLLKTETKGGGGAGKETSTPIKITNSHDIALHTVSGRIENMIQNETVGALINIENSCNIKVSSAKSFNAQGDQYTIKVNKEKEVPLFYNGLDQKNGYVSAFWINEGSTYCSNLTDDCLLFKANGGSDKNIECGKENVKLTSAKAGAGYTYSWTTSDGVEVSNLQQPIVDKAGTYTFTATDPSGNCSDSDTVLVTASACPSLVTPLTNNEVPLLENNKVSIYSNPVLDGVLTIVNNTDYNYNAAIYDIKGSMLMRSLTAVQQRISSVVVDKLTTGVYVLSLIDEKGKKTELKFIVK